MFLDDAVLRARVTNPRILPRQGTPGDMSIDRAELVAIFLEAMLYGVESLTFVATVYLLHGSKRNKAILFKFSIVIMIFLLNTIHAGSSLRRILNAFGGIGPGSTPFIIGYLSDVAGFLYRFKNILIVIQTITLDILVVYRCYMVWDKNVWVTLAPSPGIIAYLIAGIAAIHAFAIYNNDTIFTGATKTWVSATVCITLLTKLVCLTIVVLGTFIPRQKSSWQTSYLKVDRHATLYKLVLVSIESGGLAILAAFVLVPVYLKNRNAQSIVWGALSPMTGESVLLIIAASLLGLTPSTTGPSRRRKRNIPNSKVTIPAIPVSPVASPVSRFSVPGSLVKSSSSSSGYPSIPSVNNKSAPPFAESEVGYMDSRYANGYSHDSLPFNTVIATREDNSKEANIRDALAYGDSDIARKDLDMQYSAEGFPNRTFRIARSADGMVEVSQKEYAAS